MNSEFPWEIGELVSYATLTRGPVKGIIIDAFPDPEYHMMVAFRVTSLSHPLYPKNMELSVAWDDPSLKKRKRHDKKRIPGSR